MKSISEGSAADLSNKIQINDRIVEVDGHSLQGYSNHEAVEVLRSTGQNVTLCLERYLRGPKYETLQQAIAASEQGPQQPGSPSIASLPSFPISAVSHKKNISFLSLSFRGFNFTSISKLHGIMKRRNSCT